MSVPERKTAAEVIASHRYRPQDHCTIAYRSHCVCGWVRDLAGTSRTEVALHSEHVISALEAESLAVIEMPTSQMTAREGVAEPIRGLPMWTHFGAWACWRGEQTIEFEADNQRTCGDIDASEIPSLVGVLVAAARAVGGAHD